MLVLSAVSFFVYRSRKNIDCMHGMMLGMAMGMVSGLFTSAIFLIPTGNFLYGVILGSIAGLIFGLPFGKFGGSLGVMEGIIAGPVGGMMGAMLGQMVRPFDIEVFVPFFTFIFLITMAGVSYTVKNLSSGQKKKSEEISGFVLAWSIAATLLIIISIALPFSIETAKSDTLAPSGFVSGKDSDGIKLPSYLEEVSKEERKEAELKGDHQEVEVKVSLARYSPNTIIAKQGIPLRINIYADESAGCAREIIFPYFKIRKIIPVGAAETIDLNPTEKGEFKFSCSMDMARGKLIVI